MNETHAKWAWHRTTDVGGETGAADQVWLAKPPAGSCVNGRASAATDGNAGAPAPAPAPGSSASGSAHGMLLLLLLGAVAAAAVLVQ